MELRRDQIVALVLLSGLITGLLILALGVWIPIPWNVVGRAVGGFFTNTLRINLTWMDWTRPTAIFFSGLGIGLVIMTLWDIISPTQSKQGFLPIETTRGEKFFLSIISFIGIMIVTLAIFPELPETAPDRLWYAVALAGVWVVVLDIWG
jgi:predicted small integral membrane protein